MNGDSLFNFSKKRDARICEELQKGGTVSGSVSLFLLFVPKGMHVSVMENCAGEVERKV